jgi:hypothetical protein
MCGCGKRRAVGGGVRAIDDTTVATRAVPTVVPAVVPTVATRVVPTVAPRVVPTVAPRAVPTVAPRAVPTVAPRAVPTVVPTVVTRVVPTSVRPAGARPAARHVPSVRRIIRQQYVIEPTIIDPVIWGPPLWRLLHTLAELRHTDTDWPHLLTTLRSCLPCPDCTNHYNAWINGHPTNGDMKAWVLALHNDVNRRKGVTQWTPDMVSASVSSVRRIDLIALLGSIRGKVGEPACTILSRMIDRVTV